MCCVFWLAACRIADWQSAPCSHVRREISHKVRQVLSGPTQSYLQDGFGKTLSHRTIRQNSLNLVASFLACYFPPSQMHYPLL